MCRIMAKKKKKKKMEIVITLKIVMIKTGICSFFAFYSFIFVLFFKNLAIEYICRLDILNAEDRKQQ